MGYINGGSRPSLDFLPWCVQPLSLSSHLLLLFYTATTHSDLQSEACSSFIFYWPMVCKQKTTSSSIQSVQINPFSAHITPPFTLLLSPGTLLLGENGCIPEHPPFSRTSPVPIQAAPQCTITSLWDSTSKTRSVHFTPFPSPPSSDGWSTEEENKDSYSSYSEYNTCLFDNYGGLVLR